MKLYFTTEYRHRLFLRVEDQKEERVAITRMVPDTDIQLIPCHIFGEVRRFNAFHPEHCYTTRDVSQEVFTACVCGAVHTVPDVDAQIHVLINVNVTEHNSHLTAVVMTARWQLKSRQRGSFFAFDERLTDGKSFP